MRTLASALVLLLTACTKPDTQSTRYPLTGTVVGFDPGLAELTLSHNEVKGLMPAMTMPFRVTKDIPPVQPGDQVQATLVITKDLSYLREITVTKKADSGYILAPQIAARATPGSEVPDFQLTNQDNKPIHLSQYKGRILMLTFIYTRCPFPDYCPLMMKNFTAVNRELESKPEVANRVHMLSISLDSAHDTPDVLRTYGLRFLKGDDPFKRWELATASGSQIRPIAAYFGVSYNEESGQINHTLATALVDAGGRLSELFTGNQWRPAEAVKVITQLSQPNVHGP